MLTFTVLFFGFQRKHVEKWIFLQVFLTYSVKYDVLASFPLDNFLCYVIPKKLRVIELRPGHDFLDWKVHGILMVGTSCI